MFGYGHLGPVIASILLWGIWEGEYGPVLFDFSLGSL